MLFSKKIEPIALDIGSTFIKLVQLKGSNKNYQLVKFGMVALPPEVIVEGAVMDAGRVVEAIKELLSAQKVKTKEVVISVSGSSVIIKRVSVADMTDEELAESIKWEAEQYIPFSIDDVNVDFQKLGAGAAEGQADVLLVAVKKDKINDEIIVMFMPETAVMCRVPVMLKRSFHSFGILLSSPKISASSNPCCGGEKNFLSTLLKTFLKEMAIPTTGLPELRSNSSIFGQLIVE